MAVPAATVPGLALEGITLVNDLGEHEDDDFKQVSNMRTPAGSGAAFLFGAKPLKQLKVAAKNVYFYALVD